MHLSHNPQHTIQNKNVHISVLNGALWNMGQVHFGICEIDLGWVFFDLTTDIGHSFTGEL